LPLFRNALGAGDFRGFLLPRRENHQGIRPQTPGGSASTPASEVCFLHTFH
jgi:hypothetical protein